MLERLPKFIIPLQLVDNRGRLRGQMPLIELTRLESILYTNDRNNYAYVDLIFEREGNVSKIEGTIKTDLKLLCQNCLHPLNQHLDISIKLGIVSSIDQADRLSEEFEPFLLEEEKILLSTLIEDELLLNIPDYPKHKNNCLTHVKDTSNQTNECITEKKENPFSILVNLKHTGDLNGSTKK